MRGDEASRLITNVYETVGDVGRRPDAIDAFRRAVGADAAIQFSSDIRSGTIERTRTAHRRVIIGIDASLAELHACAAMLSETLHAVAIPLLCIDERGRCLWANDGAERLLARRDGLSLDRDRRLSAATACGTAAVRRIAHGLAAGVPAACAIDRPSGGSPLAVVGTPLAPARRDEAYAILGAPVRPAGIVAIHAEPPANRKTLDLLGDRLSEIYGLTKAEARTAVALFRQPGLRAAADRLGVTRSTVQTHLSHIFAKMAVSSQSELMRRLRALLVT